MIPRYLVFLDTETGGLEDEHPIVQLALMAVDTTTGARVDSAWWPLEYDAARVTPEARALWGAHEEEWGMKITPAIVVQRATIFFKRWACVQKISKRTGRGYNIAQLVCHNAKFDTRRVELLWKQFDAFCPATIYQALCTLELSRWILPHLPSHALSELCLYCGIEMTMLHDARGDVLATVELWKKLRVRPIA